MKISKRLLFVTIIATLLLSMVGCAPNEKKAEQFSRGLFDLILSDKTLDYLEPNASINFGEGLGGNLARLFNTSSHQSTTTIRVPSLNVFEDVDSFVRGKRLTIETAYDMSSGQGLLGFDGFGINGEMALDKDQIFINIPMIFQNNGFLLNFDSKLNFSKNIPLLERITDLTESIATSLDEEASDTKMDLNALRDIRNNYIKVIANSLDPNKITKLETSMMVLGKAEKVDLLNIKMDQDDVAKVTQAVLEAAKADNQLLDFIADIALSSPDASYYYEDADEFKDEIISMIDDLLVNLDSHSDYRDQFDLEISLYFRKPRFLSRTLPEPIATKFVFDDDWSGFDVFVKRVIEGRAFDIEALYDSEYFVTQLKLSNIKQANTYHLRGTIDIPEFGAIDVRGETLLASGKETGNYTVTINADEGLYLGLDSAEIKINTELTEVKKSSDYLQNISLEFDAEGYYENLSGKLTIESAIHFLKNIKVDMPSFSGAERFDSIMELIEYFN